MQPVNGINNKSRQLTLPFNVINGFVKLSPFAVERTFNKGNAFREEIKAVKDLYKIGYSETTVEDRIRNAANETTYLMTKVKVVTSYKMYNVNTQKFEDLLHRFFDSARLSIDVMDNNGTRHMVREWFQVPLGVIEQAIYLFQTGEIVNYYYSREKQEILKIKC